MTIASQRRPPARYPARQWLLRYVLCAVLLGLCERWVRKRFLTRFLLLCYSGIRLGAVTDCDNCESNATASELSSSSMAIKVSTVFPVASLMREIGLLALSHTRLSLCYTRNHRGAAPVSYNCESNATACEISSSSKAIMVSIVCHVASLMHVIGQHTLSHTSFVVLLH